MKKISLIMLALLLTTFLIACGDSSKSNTELSSTNDPENQQEYVLKLSHPYQESTLHHKYMEWFNEEVQKRSDGKLSLEIYPSSQLMSPDQEFPAMLNGKIDMTHTLSSIASSFDPIWEVFDVPFLFDYDPEDPSVYIKNKDKFINSEEGGKKISKRMEDKGLKVLSLSSTDIFGSPFTTSSEDKITDPDSIKNIKIRTSGGSVVPNMLKEVGASGVSISGSELVTALQQNTVDGLITVPMYAYDNKLPVKNYTVLPLVNYVMPVMISLEKFESLPKELQDILVETGKDLEDHANKVVEESVLDVYEKYESEFGLDIYYPTEEEIEKWEKAVEPIWNDVKNDVEGASELLEEASKGN